MGRAESAPSWAYQCLLWGVSNHALLVGWQAGAKSKMKTTIGKILGLALLTATYFGTIFNSSAQATRNFRPETNAPYALLRNPALTNSPTAVAMITEVLATTPAPMSVPVVSTTNNSEGGTYWTMQSPVPLPGDFFPDLPVYLLDSTNRTFLIDDRSVDYAAGGGKCNQRFGRTVSCKRPDD
jgi:hypothetical protein